MNVRRSVAAVVMSLGLLSVAACGDEANLGLEAVKISAEAGKEPTITYEDGFAPEKVEVKVLTEGEGPKTTEADGVQANLWISNSVSKKVPLNTYAEGEEPAEVLLKDLMPGIKKALVGQKAGSVVAVTGPAKDLFGDYGYPEWEIGHGDAVVIRAEVVKILSTEERDALVAEQEAYEEQVKKAQEEQEKAQAEAEKEQEANAKLIADAAPKLEKAKKEALPAAKGVKARAAAWAPTVTFPGKDGVPTINFTGTPKPTGKLQVTELIKGTGKKVAKGDGVVVKYVGQVHGASAPFDSSYSRGDVLDFVAGAGQMISGFDTAVTGQRVGTRLIVQIPPELGYGSTGSEGAGIKGTDTIVFVVDIVGAA